MVVKGLLKYLILGILSLLYTIKNPKALNKLWGSCFEN